MALFKSRRSKSYNLSVLVAFVVTSAILVGCDAHVEAPGREDVTRGAESSVASQGEGTTSTSEIYAFADMEVVDGATARLRRTFDAISTRTNTAELNHHDVTTMWWVIFNNPDECDGDCGDADLFDGPEGPTGVQPSCVFADGSLVGGNGHARFQDRLKVGESRNSCIDFFVDAVDELEGEDYGLQNPDGAEIHLVVRSHGPLLPGMVREQRSTFAGGCEELLNPGEDDLEEGECSDQQFAVFPPPNN